MSDMHAGKRVADTNATDQGESKKAEMGDKVSVQSSPGEKDLPSRRGVLIELVVENIEKMNDFLGKVVGAREYFRAVDESCGKVWHEALDLDNVCLMAEEFGHSMYHGEPKPHVRLHLNMDDPVSVAEKLVKAGAKTLNKCEPQFWGSTWGVFEDPSGIVWNISNSSRTLEDVPKELERKIVPFVSVSKAPEFLKFISDVFGAEEMVPPAKDPNGMIMCAQMNLNGGLIMVGDKCCAESEQEGPTISVSYETSPGNAAPLSRTFEVNGGETLEVPSMQFWGQVWGRSKDPFGNSWALNEPCSDPPPSDEEMAIDMRVGAKHDWRWSWVAEDVPPIHCFGEVRTCLAKSEHISPAMKEMIPKAFAGAAEKGLPPVGPVVGAFYTWDSKEDGESRFTAGPSVAVGSPEAEGDGLGVRTLAGCKCATTLHTGAYSELMQAYGATFEWIAAKGYESVMPCIEIFENSPEDTEESKLRTKICIPVVPKASS